MAGVMFYFILILFASVSDPPGILTPKRAAIINSERKLTPKQLQKKLEAEKRQEEKQKAKEERERKLQEEKEQKQKEREEKERQRKKEKEEKEQQRQKEKDEKEEQKRKEKEERDKKKQAEIDAKNEEKRVRDEEKKRKEEQKEEERKKKEDEKLAAEEEKNKKARKEAEAFSKFFLSRKSAVKKADVEDTEIMEPEANNNFMPFQIKEDMKLAPTVRRVLSDERRRALENLLNVEKQNVQIEDLYLMNLRTGVRVPEHDKRTLPNEDDDDEDIQVIGKIKLFNFGRFHKLIFSFLEDDLEGAAIPIEEEKNKQTYRAKYLKFHENQRPAYYGTWRKISRNVKPRRPFAIDKVRIGYK